MCPEQHVYLDHRQADGPDEPMPVGWVRTLRDVYAFEPVPPALAGRDAARHVIGTQANLWTELIDDQGRADYQTWPRLCALAEVAWSAAGRRSWPDFERRMTHAHYARLDALGVAYRPPGGPHPGSGGRCPPGYPDNSGVRWTGSRAEYRTGVTRFRNEGDPGTGGAEKCARVASHTVRLGSRDSREGAAGLSTHAPQASGAPQTARLVAQPATLDDAVAALVATPAAVPVAGGTDLMAGVNAGLLRPAALVSLGRLGELRGWEYQDGHALLGACLTHARMSRPDFAALIPALAAAARSAGPPQVRNAGTLGGNIITAAPSGDTLPVLAALEATLLVAGPEGQGRQIPVSSLLAGMDRLHPAELLAHVRVPLLHAPRHS